MDSQKPSPTRLYSLLVLVLASLAIALTLSQVLSGSPTPLSILSSPLVSPLKRVSDADETLVTTNTSRPNHIITYTLTLSNAGTGSATVLLTDTIAVNGSPISGSATASSGLASISGNTLTWNGALNPGDAVTITFQVQLTSTVSTTLLTNTFDLAYNGTVTTSNIVTTTIEPYRAYLPIVRKPAHVFIPIVLRQTRFYVFVPVVVQQ